MVRSITKYITPQRLRFLIASGASFALMMGITTLLAESGLLPPDAGYAVATVITVTVNFFLYRYYIFPGDHKPIWTLAAQFVSSVILFRVVELAAFSLLYRATGLNYAVVMVLVLGTSFVCKYLFMGAFVFKGKGPSPEAAPADHGRDASDIDSPNHPTSKEPTR